MRPVRKAATTLYMQRTAKAQVGITELGGLAVLVKSILQCIGISKKQEVEAEPVEGTVKNAETTQGR